jgi:hypothetical protein
MLTADSVVETRTECSVLNAFLITTVFATRPTSCLLVSSVRKNPQNSFTADAKNVLLHHFVDDEHQLEILLPVGVLLSYSALPCQDTH